MRASTFAWPFLLSALVSWTPEVGAHAPDSRPIGWSWDQVVFRTATSGDVECAVKGALLQPAEPGEPALPAALVRVAAPDGARPSGFEIVGEVSTLRDLPGPLAPALQDAPSVAGGPVYVGPLASAYNAPAFPADRVRYLGLTLGRGVAWANFAVYPLVIENGRSVRLLEQGTLVVRWQSDPSAPRPLKSLVAPSLPSEPLGRAHARLNRGRTLDGTATARPSLAGGPIPYLVLTSKDLSVDAKAFVEWKNQTGTPATLRTVEWVDSVYVDGVDGQDRIRNFLIEAYRYWGTKWLLIVGGPSEVPIRTARSYSWNCPAGIDIITDLYYACLDGTWNADGDAVFGEAPKNNCPENPVSDVVDFDAELLVGRIPADSREQLQTYLAKYMSYVQNPDTGGYLDRVLLLGEVLFDASWDRAQLLRNPPCSRCTNNQPPCTPCVRLDGAEDCVRVINIMDSGPSGFSPIYDELYEWYEYWRTHEENPRPNAILERRDDVMAKFNEGSGWIHHVGHGDRDRWSVGTTAGNDGGGRILVGDVRSLTNGNRVGCVYSINCNSAAIDYDSFGEAMMFAPNGGEVLYIGSTNLDFPSAATGFQNDTYTKLFADGYPTIGEAFYETISDQMAPWGDRESYQRFLSYSIILLGDPQLGIWMGTPKALAANAPTSVMLGDSLLTVTVSRQEDGTPVSGALVTVYKANDVWASDTTRANGQVAVSFRPTTIGSFKIAVTERSSVPYTETSIRTVMSALTASVVSVSQLIVDDRTGADTNGNDNGQFEEGETVKIKVMLRNTGGIASGAVGLSFTVEPAELAPFLEILDGTETVNTPIGAGQTAQIPGAFRIKRLPSAPPNLYENGDRLPFVLAIKVREGGRSVTFRMPLPSYRPVLDLEHGTLAELPGGNGDNRPDNGETMMWRPLLRNVGTGAAANLEGVITAQGGSLVEGYDRFPLESGNQGETLSTTSDSSFRFLVSDAANLRLSFRIRSVLDPDNFSFFDREIEFAPPNAPFFPVGTPPLATKDAILMTWLAPVLATDIQGYVLERTKTPDTGYVRVHGRLLSEMTFFKDEGLEGLTQYYYRVAAVDNSGNQSDYSQSSAATTSPAVSEGWPFGVTADMNTGSPTIENIDQVGHYEVFLTADKLYGLRDHAQEIIDGDGISSTPGVWSSQGSFFWSKPAIADIDGDGGVEIVATARYKDDNVKTGTVFVWRADGTLFWSKPVGTSQYLVASPVLADIAGDSKLEVVVQLMGTLYAWDSSGNPVRAGNADGKLQYVGGGNPSEPPFAYGSPAVADVDGSDGGKDEIILCLARKETGSPSSLVVVDGDGAMLATVVLETSLPSDEIPSDSSPAVVDLGLDGQYEIFVATRNFLWCWRYNHNFARLDRLWQYPIPKLTTKGFEPSPGLGDIDGNGVLDVVVGAGQGKLVAVNASSGQALTGWPKEITASTKKLGSPILVNLDSDLQPEIVIGDNEGIVRALNGDGSIVPGFPYTLGGRVQHGLACWDTDRDRHPNLVLVADQLPQVTMLDISNVDFPTDLRQAMERNPWSCFRHDARNTGRFDADVITPTAVIEVTARAEPGAAILTWDTPEPAAFFRVLRLDGANRWEVRAEGPASQFAEEAGPGTSYRYRDESDAGRQTYRVLGYDDGGKEVYQSFETSVTVPPFRLRFTGIVPNPSKGLTAIRFESPAGPVRLEIMDLTGRRIRTLTRGVSRAGVTELSWDGRDEQGHEVGSGVYLARLQGKEGSESKKLVLLR